MAPSNTFGHIFKIYNVFRSAIVRHSTVSIGFGYNSIRTNLYKKAVTEYKRANEIVKEISQFYSNTPKFTVDRYLRTFSVGRGDLFYDSGTSKSGGYICKSKSDDCDCPTVENKCKDKGSKRKEKVSDRCKCNKDSDKKKRKDSGKIDPCKKKKDSGKRKEDPCKKKKHDPCKKKDSGKKKKDSGKKKHDPCKKKDSGKKKEDPCKRKEDPCKKKEDPCKKKEDPCKRKEDPCKKKDDPCKRKEDPCKRKEDPCKKKEDPCKKKKDSGKRKEDPCAPKSPKKCKSSDSSSSYPIINDPCTNLKYEAAQDTEPITPEESDFDIFKEVEVFDYEKREASEEYFKDNYKNLPFSYSNYGYYDLVSYLSDARLPQPSALPLEEDKDNEVD